jgi:hypothetical protein
MAKEIDLSIEHKRNNQIFEDLASIFERTNFNSPSLQDRGIKMLMQVERRFQDLDDITSALGKASPEYLQTSINCCREFLTYWKHFLSVKSTEDLFEEYLVFLEKLLVLLTELKNVSGRYEKFFPYIKELFNSIEPLLKEHKIEVNYETFLAENSPVKIEGIEKVELPEELKHREIVKSSKRPKKIIPVDPLDHDNQKPDPKNTPAPSYSFDKENFLYEWDMELWIDTKDAAKANHFMYLVSSTLSYIDDVELTLVDIRIGSLWQKWKIKIIGFFAKKRTQEVLAKALKTAEVYSMDRHIEPVEKTKAEKEQIEATTKTILTEAQANKLNELIIEEKEQDVLAKKLANTERLLHIDNSIGQRLGKGLFEFEDDFRIMIKGLLFAEQKNKQLNIGNIDSLTTDEPL